MSQKEIVDIAVTLYDELRIGEQGFCPVAKSGFIKCKICGEDKCKSEVLIYENSEYGDNIKEYIENRCIKEGGIRYVRLFDENHWHLPFYCIATARKQDDFLILEFQEGVCCGTADRDYHFVRARSVTNKNVQKILVDFDNCDSFEIFAEEIKEMNLNFEEELSWGASSFQRKVRKGYIRLMLDKTIDWRKSDIAWMKGKDTLTKLEKRLCGKGKADIDICHLYITYNYAGYCMYLEECIKVDDIRPIEEQEDEWCYISGYAEKQRDGSILIILGK